LSSKAPTPILSHQDSLSSKAPTPILSHQDSLSSNKSGNAYHSADYDLPSLINQDTAFHSSDQVKQGVFDRPISSPNSFRNHPSPLLDEEGQQDDSILSLELNNIQDLMPGDRSTLNVRRRK